MHKLAVSALLGAPSLVAGSVFFTPVNNVSHRAFRLIDEALIIIPVENAEYSDYATNLYLDPLGFSGTPTTLIMPEVVAGGTLDQAVNVGEQDLVSAVESDYNAGEISPTDPLYVFGYSQSSVVAGMAEQQLAADQIPSQDLNFVLVGDSASAEGGFLNTFLNSLPESWQQSVVDAFNLFGADEVLGAITPDNLYPTEVYSLSGDGWANYDGGLNVLGMFSDHVEYLGLTPTEIASAGPPVVDGMTDYFTIQDSMVNSLEALWTQLLMAVSVF